MTSDPQGQIPRSFVFVFNSIVNVKSSGKIN